MVKALENYLLYFSLLNQTATSKPPDLCNKNEPLQNNFINALMTRDSLKILVDNHFRPDIYWSNSKSLE